MMDGLYLFLRKLHRDENGAAFIEYTALLGVILAVGLLVLTQVGTWANVVWGNLCAGIASTAANCGSNS